MRDILKGKKIYYYCPPQKKGYDRHHIKPKHAGGTAADGIVYVTREEHAELHLQLFLENGDYRDGMAVNLILERNVIDISGENNPNWGNPTNYKMSEESKRKLSEMRMGKNNPFYGKKVSEEHKEKLRKLFTGVPLLEKTKKKISEANIGKVRTPEMRKHLSEVTKEQYRNGRVGNMTGKNHSAETKNKMSEAKMGKPSPLKGKTNEQIVGKEKAERLSAAQSKRMKGHKYGVGRVLSEETKRKISERLKGNKNCVGRVLSEETKRKIIKTKARNKAKKEEK